MTFQQLVFNLPLFEVIIMFVKLFQNEHLQGRAMNIFENICVLKTSGVRLSIVVAFLKVHHSCLTCLNCFAWSLSFSSGVYSK